MLGYHRTSVSNNEINGMLDDVRTWKLTGERAKQRTSFDPVDWVLICSYLGVNQVYFT